MFSKGPKVITLQDLIEEVDNSRSPSFFISKKNKSLDKKLCSLPNSEIEKNISFPEKSLPTSHKKPFEECVEQTTTTATVVEDRNISSIDLSNKNKEEKEKGSSTSKNKYNIRKEEIIWL